MKLHVLTAITRPANLPRIAESLAAAAQAAPDVDLIWHWRFDMERRHVGGQALKNAMLDQIGDGWVWALDDDTLVHPRQIATVAAAIWEAPATIRAVVVGQQRRDGVCGGELHAHPDWMRVGSVDIGQAVLRRDLIGDHRLPETYDGDGRFLSALYAAQPVAFLFCDEPLSFHNAIG